MDNLNIYVKINIMNNNQKYIILGIETSCDETASSVLEIKSLSKQIKIKTISNIVSSQIKIHRQHGGIIPEVAARAHIENILAVVKESLKNLKNPAKQIDLIAVTNGPGLITSLLVGV